ncbi:iron complex outermembrane receptor protein [Flavobacterium nitrogenifigens]|uniref:Iron complex outermembrane receptor protein n=2 Tax=Flavobacterium TaxID=237 RepID=A0A7W7N6C3_9FLAO|nr:MULTISPECIES: TonB-dependent receptor [Flavobacterium]MBB4800269.1 iron complex outermembrane receptor protein [Flavobacterium nitrogenifigens]MBB6385981.1 iron complex outermembrane receptor protein [Flavobacterium notoginsengisoli]
MKTFFLGTEVLRFKGSKAQKKVGTKFVFSTFSLFFALCSFAQQQKDSTKVNSLDEVLVSAVRVTSKTPVSFSNMDKKEIKYRNLGQDIPVLMNYLPSVVTTSDAGNGVGYTGIRVRGSDATRVNVTINGIPYNDAESQGTFWVNMPDFASSVESLQLQRGVGTSTNGAGAFGASLNMLTDSYARKATGEISSSAGSFNTLKNTVKFSTGLLNDHFEIAGRLSAIKTDGYIDRGSADLKSYFLQGTYVGKTTLIKALVFGGTQKTYQSWNGIDSEKLSENRRYNSAGEYTDEFGVKRYYDNETDNYNQDHYQLHWSESISDKWSTNFALHYTKGKGYFENYKEDAEMSEYALAPVGTITTTDLIRQKWLDNDFYGTTFSAKYVTDGLDVILGGGWNKYEGDHFGKVIWARYASTSELGDHYYDDFSTKTDGNIFAKANYQLTEQLSLYGDLQYRNVHYKANSADTGLVNDNFNFFNPKAGLNYAFSEKSTLYFSYARANREPNRTDYEGGNVKPEKLNDYELGWRFNSEIVQLNSNVYYMAYKDQLILTGTLDDVGNPIRANSEKSYRLGVEIDATIAITDKIFFRPNFTLSSNKNVDLAVDGEYYGTTKIAYSPEIIAGNVIVYKPIEGLYLSLLQKYVGEQFMNNIELPAAKLADYFVNDLNASYEIKPKSIFKSITVTALVNNIFNKKYISNGAMYDIYPYYYPQAGRNFLIGLSLKF